MAQYGDPHRSSAFAKRITPHPANDAAPFAGTASPRYAREADEGLTKAALENFGTTRNDAYEAALTTLREDTRDGGTPSLRGRSRKRTSPAIALTLRSLRDFLETEVADWYWRERLGLTSRPAVRDQAFGEALDPEKIERLSRYEVHLDRKLELRCGHRDVPEETPMKFRPLHDRVVVRRVDAEEKTKGGIIIPDTAKEKPQEGEIVAAGPGARDESGKLVPLDVKAGDRILFGKWSGTEVKIDGEDLLIMKESDVMGVVEGTPALKRKAA